ncbi:MAG TPA: helix-turn-helix transcriptional regulator [Terriglobales bacterium]|nr:helix-turn-helix transcriptional regulator [Terriglobales bacterium]
MKASEKESLLNFVSRLADGLGQTLGRFCEIVVHDFDSPESSIIAIANGSLTGREVGDTLDALGFQLLKNNPPTDLLNYRAKTKDGKELRSSSIFLRDEKGHIFGALCINVDVSGLLRAQEWLQEALGAASNTIDERFEHSVDEVLETLIQNAISSIGKNTSDMTREDKVAIVAYLENKGAFLIRYSVERVAELLGMTKYTIYNYLDEIRKKQEVGEIEAAKTH